MTEYGGAGDPTRSMQLLWGTREAPTRGPKPGLELSAIVTAATGVADDQGLAALSMRKVAEALGVGTMSLYRYVPGKAELLDLMLDRAHGEMLAADQPPPDPADWRERLSAVARSHHALLLRHPWMLQVAISRPPLGPNVLAVYERDLAAVDGCGLTDLEMDAVVTLVAGFVASAARGALDVALAQARTGLTDQQWWEAHAPLLEQVFDVERFPLAARVGAAAGEAQQAAYDPGLAFEFGLARLLDGVAALLR